MVRHPTGKCIDELIGAFADLAMLVQRPYLEAARVDVIQRRTEEFVQVRISNDGL